MAIWMIVGLWLVYLALTANLELANLALGLLIAVALTALLRPPRGTFELRRLPAALLALVRYIIPSGCDSELATALSAHAITLAPGEMVVEIGEGGIMYTHTLDVTQAAEYVAEAQQLRRELLRKIFP
jgi:multicomponent Na+:H+ antiporter subunit E